MDTSHHKPSRRRKPGDRQDSHPTRPPRPRPPRALRGLPPLPGAIAREEVDLLLAQTDSDTPPDLSDPRVVRRMLRQHGIRPNKSFGQHLLMDRDALEAIVAAAEVGPEDTVLEAGAGMGVLTVALAERAGRVVAVELEREILPALRENTARFANVEVLEGNLLEVRPETLFGQAPYKLVANLPYYLTASALRHFLEAANRPSRLVVMVQKEVAERLVAAPGDLSLLAVSVQFYGRPSLVRIVPAASFVPPPRVDSAIVRVDVYAEPPLDPATRDVLFGIVRAGFAERRRRATSRRRARPSRCGWRRQASMPLAAPRRSAWRTGYG
jgi:16S rRNA (adenine1518-N6/adenine1519-N6)-dimethyltransferase